MKIKKTPTGLCLKCSGPCMSHCYCSKTVRFFAAIAMIYTIASLWYLVITTQDNIGTPFADSLTKKQENILRDSKSKRKRIFYTGLVVGITIVLLVLPKAMPTVSPY